MIFTVVQYIITKSNLKFRMKKLIICKCCLIPLSICLFVLYCSEHFRSVQVDVYISLHRQMENWKLLGTGLTDSHGRLEFPVPESESVPQGIHAVKMVVR